MSGKLLRSACSNIILNYLTTVVILFRSFAILRRQWEVNNYLLSSAQEYCTPQVTVLTIIIIIIIYIYK